MKRCGNQKTTDKGIKFPGVAEPNVLIVVKPERMASSLNAKKGKGRETAAAKRPLCWF